MGPCQSSASGQPAAASIASRACFTSDSRIHMSERAVSFVFGPRIMSWPQRLYSVTFLRAVKEESIGARATGGRIAGTVNFTPSLNRVTKPSGSNPTSPASEPSR